jgi:YABBY protein
MTVFSLLFTSQHTSNMAKEAAAKPAAAKADAPAKAGKKKGSGGKKVSPYNRYMKEQLAVLKAEKPDMPHQERFKLVAQRWKTAKENPVSEKA